MTNVSRQASALLATSAALAKGDPGLHRFAVAALLGAGLSTLGTGMALGQVTEVAPLTSTGHPAFAPPDADTATFFRLAAIPE